MSWNRMNRTWFGISAAVAAPLLIVYAPWWLGGPIFSADKLLSLRGKTREDVRQILGEPSRIMEYGDWHYSRILNPGWVEIRFRDDGRISSVNDEQVDPVTFGSGSWHDDAVNPPAETPASPPDSR